MSLFDLFKKSPPKQPAPMPQITFMSQDSWLEAMLDILDEKDKAKERRNDPQ